MALDGLSELPEMRFKFPFNLIEKSTMVFQQGNHGAYSNPSTQVGARTTRFSALDSQTDVTIVSFVSGAGYCALSLVNIQQLFLEPDWALSE